MIQHNGPISGVACSRQFIATAGYDNQLILWDAKTKMALARGLHDHLVNRCEFSPDENLLVSASSDYSARIWSVPEMRLLTVLNGHRDDVEMARFAPHGESVATVSQDGCLRVFDLSGRLKCELSDHKGCAQSLAWSSDGNRIVTSGDDGTIRTWNLMTGEQESIEQPETVQTDAVAICSDGVVFAGNDAGYIIRYKEGQVSKILAHRSGVKNLIINQNETAAISVSYDRDLALVDIQGDLNVIKKIALPAMVWARACAFKTDSHLIFGTFGSSYANLNLQTEEWDLSSVSSTDCLNAVLVDNESVIAVGDSGQVRKAGLKSFNSKIVPRESVSDMGSLCNFIVRFGARVVCGGHLGKIFDSHTGDELLALGQPINKAIQAGEYLVLATYSGEIAIVRETSKGVLELVSRQKILQNAVKDLAVEDNLVFCCGAAADIAIFSLKEMRLVGLKTEAHDNIVNSCVGLGHGRFATVSRDLKLKVWNGVENEESLQTPFDHSIKCVSASADFRYIGAAAYDGTMAIYDRESRTWPVFRRLTAAGVSSLSFAAESFWASAYDGNIYQVELP